MSRYNLPLSISHATETMSDMNSHAAYRHIQLTYQEWGTWRTATLRLSQPQSRNMVNEAMAEEFRDACGQVAEDDGCRLLTVTGAGDAFSVGRCAVGGDGEEIANQISRLRVSHALASLPIPTLAIINGDAIGQGLELALAADLRIATETAMLALWEPGQPCMPWDGGTQRLPRLVGPSWALDLALTGRQVGAREGLKLGLVNRVAAPAQLDEASRQLIEECLTAAPIASQYAKEAVQKGMDLALEQGLRLEADLSVILQSTQDRAEGIASFQERRGPRFRGA